MRSLIKYVKLRITDEKEEMYMSAGITVPEKGQWEGDTEPIAKCSITDLKNHKTHLYIIVVEIKIKVRTRKLQRNFLRCFKLQG